MRSPNLTELPPPPEGKTGWPWTVETPPLPPTRPDGSPWPRISIVTPSYNQGQFIEETIRSILLQGYPDLEYIIIDGGSKDSTLDIISKYSRWFTYWHSKRDRGQADAVNIGLSLSTGEIFQFINSDDLLCQSACRRVAEEMDDFDAVAGVVLNFGGGESYVKRNNGLTPEDLIFEVFDHAACRYHQPGVWLRRAKLQELGGFDISFRYLFDLVAYVRYFERWTRVRHIDDILAHFRAHEDSKSVGEIQKFDREHWLARRSLESTLKSKRLRLFSSKVAESFRWQRAVVAITNHSSASSRRRARLLLKLIAHSPRARMNRFALGALRRLLLKCA